MLGPGPTGDRGMGSLCPGRRSAGWQPGVLGPSQPPRPPCAATPGSGAAASAQGCPRWAQSEEQVENQVVSNVRTRDRDEALNKVLFSKPRWAVAHGDRCRKAHITCVSTDWAPTKARPCLVSTPELTPSRGSFEMGEGSSLRVRSRRWDPRSREAGAGFEPTLEGEPGLRPSPSPLCPHFVFVSICLRLSHSFPLLPFSPLPLPQCFLLSLLHLLCPPNPGDPPNVPPHPPHRVHFGAPSTCRQ